MVNKATLKHKHLVHRNRLLGYGNDFSQKLDQSINNQKTQSLKIDPHRLNALPKNTQGRFQSMVLNQNLDRVLETRVEKTQTPNQVAKTDEKIDIHNLPHKLKPYWNTIQSECGKHGIDPLLVASMIRQESNFNPNAISKHNAMGLMQIIPGTAEELNLSDPFDPDQNIKAGVNYLAKMLDRFDGNEQLALAAYNAGPGNVEKYNNSIPPFSETIDYVRRITRFKDSLAIHGSFNPPTKKFV
jgi:soluble lytic murein transglycosylase-like protein